MEYKHSVSLDLDKCKGCTHCLRRCPTEAIRIRDGHAVINAIQCIDCGECIRVCPYKAKRAICDSLEDLDRSKYLIALPAPSLFGQFINVTDVDYVLQGLIAGGDKAIRNAVEAAEDDPNGGWRDMQPFNPTVNDIVIGIAASGTTPYVVGTVKKAREEGLLTGCITCNHGSPVAAAAEIPVEVVVGPEFVTGSTRMKSGTAQKLVLNMISTSAMILMGHVKGNKMMDMQLTNIKLVGRGTRMIMEETGITDAELAKDMLLRYGSVRDAVNAYHKK